MAQTRSEHLAQCKKTAKEYLEQGNVTQALTSMFSDLGKHPETANHIGIQLGMMQMMGGHLSTIDAAEHFIDGFN